MLPILHEKNECDFCINSHNPYAFAAYAGAASAKTIARASSRHNSCLRVCFIVFAPFLWVFPYEHTEIYVHFFSLFCIPYFPV